jgi:hypothetical protein
MGAHVSTFGTDAPIFGFRHCSHSVGEIYRRPRVFFCRVIREVEQPPAFGTEFKVVKHSHVGPANRPAQPIVWVICSTGALFVWAKADLGPQDPILLPQVIDRMLLLLIDPAG